MSTFHVMIDRDGAECIVLVRDGVISFVPTDPANADFRAYEEWLAEGNTPQPWPPAE